MSERIGGGERVRDRDPRSYFTSEIKGEKSRHVREMLTFRRSLNEEQMDQEMFLLF